jgi:hypothetical protein
MRLNLESGKVLMRVITDSLPEYPDKVFFRETIFQAISSTLIFRVRTFPLMQELFPHGTGRDALGNLVVAGPAHGQTIVQKTGKKMQRGFLECGISRTGQLQKILELETEIAIYRQYRLSRRKRRIERTNESRIGEAYNCSSSAGNENRIA